MKHKRRSAAVIYFVLLVLNSAAPALAKKNACSFIRIPVFFITDRNLMTPIKKNPDSIAFGPHRKYIVDCKHDSYMGVAYSVVENIEDKSITKEQHWAGKKQTKKEVTKPL